MSLAVHTLPPFRRDFYLHQADILQKLASEVSMTPGPVLVAGDMNAASWAPLLKRFQETAGVRKAVCGSRWTPTWLAPVPGIGLELDHFFRQERACGQKTANSDTSTVPITGRSLPNSLLQTASRPTDLRRQACVHPVKAPWTRYNAVRIKDFHSERRGFYPEEPGSSQTDAARPLRT